MGRSRVMFAHSISAAGRPGDAHLRRIAWLDIGVGIGIGVVIGIGSVLVFRSPPTYLPRQVVCGPGDFWGGEERSLGAGAPAEGQARFVN